MRAGSEALNVKRRPKVARLKQRLISGVGGSAPGGSAESEPVSGGASIQGTCVDVRCVAGSARRR